MDSVIQIDKTSNSPVDYYIIIMFTYGQKLHSLYVMLLHSYKL